MAYRERKCEHCNQWTDGNLDRCNYCGLVLDQETKKENEARKLKVPEPPLIKINEDDHLLVKGFKRIVQFHQLVFYWIVTIVIYFITWVVF